MAYRLSLADDPPGELRRCAREQLDNAIEQLVKRRADDPVQAVHDARKSVKKTRSLLPLVRSDLGGSAYRRENAAVREAARRLSDVRDADVLVETVDALK